MNYIPSSGEHILNLMVGMLSYGVVLVFLVVGILLCALRYDTAPARYASTAALFALMLCTGLIWPLVRVWLHDFGIRNGVPIDPLFVGIGVLEIGLIMALPTLAIIAITSTTDDP